MCVCLLSPLPCSHGDIDRNYSLINVYSSFDVANASWGLYHFCVKIISL